MLVSFRNTGALLRLSFANHEVLPNKIIGLDKTNKKLLIVEGNGKDYGTECIDLTEVKTCRVKRIYHAIKAGGFSQKKLHDYLSAVAIEFKFRNNSNSFVLDFYKPQANIMYKVADIERKARKWEALLSKILAPMPPQAIKVTAN
jgi:hypothetical protein